MLKFIEHRTRVSWLEEKMLNKDETERVGNFDIAAEIGDT